MSTITTLVHAAPSGHRLHVGAPRAAAALADAIDHAAVRVDGSIWGLDAAGSGAVVGAALERAARRGVLVRLDVDAIGTRPFPWSSAGRQLRRLRDAGADVRVTLPWRDTRAPLGVDHRKAFAIDDTDAFVGGANFLALGDTWADVTVQLRDAGAAAALRSRLAARRAHVSGHPPLVGPAVPAAPHRVLESDPTRGVDEILPEVLGAIDGARHHVHVVSPWLTHRGIVDALARARTRGVQVTAITSGAPLAGGQLGGRITTRYVRTFTDELVRAGAQVVESAEPVHAKLVQADDELIAGSWNLTRQGAERDVELVVRTSDPGLVDAARALVARLGAEGRTLGRGDVDGRLHRAIDAVVERTGIEY